MYKKLRFPNGACLALAAIFSVCAAGCTVAAPQTADQPSPGIVSVPHTNPKMDGPPTAP